LNQRTLELAKPKDKEDEPEEKPLVNPKALKAKPTPRILELAKPRVVNA
jgi:Testicular haploid expressed repeat